MSKVGEIKPGDRVTITTRTQQYQGVIIPSPKKDVLILKADSGYNIGIPEQDVTNLVVQKAVGKVPVVQPATAPASDLKPTIVPSGSVKSALKPSASKKHLPLICILHTGGTIASKVDYRTGGVVSAFSPEELLGLFPELRDIALIRSELVSQMWSDDLRFANLSKLAQKIEEQYRTHTPQGIIIGMGTDNLAVAAAAVSFMVEQTPIPIIFVGAQRSSDRGSSDAAMNLICAAEFIVQTDFSGVAICMHGSSSDQFCSILPATKTYKLHASRRDAFKAINSRPLARVGYHDRAIVFETGPVEKSQQENSLEGPPGKNKETPKALILKQHMEEKVGLLKIHLNMFPEQFSLFNGYKGLIIEGTGLGHTPGQSPNPETEIHRKIYPAIKEVIDAGCVVVMTTQCLFGRVNLQVYDKGRDLLELGVLSGKDMLAPTALVKLSWLLANYPLDKVRMLISQNLRGEINETLKYEEDFTE